MDSEPNRHVEEMEAVHQPKKLNFHPPWLKLVSEISNLPPGETNPSPDTAAFPQGDQLATWWQVDYIGLFPPWKRQGFSFTVINTFSRYRFAFIANWVMASMTIWRFMKYLINPECCATLPRNKGLTILQKRCSHGTWSTDPNTFPTSQMLPICGLKKYSLRSAAEVPA